MPDGFLKRTACQIAAQLPDDRAEALQVLGYVREIVMNLGGGWGPAVVPQPIQLFDPSAQKDRAVSPADGPAVPSARLDRANPT